MQEQELLNKLESIVDQVKTGILVTSDQEGKPHVRWMTPALLKDRPGVIFALTMPESHKIAEITSIGYVEWMIQTASLSEVVNVRGLARIIDNPALKTEIMEHLASRLAAFWKISQGNMDFVVIETVIQEAIYFVPTTGQSQTILFKGNHNDCCGD